MYLQKLINIFYKEYSKKPIATSSFLNSTLPIARPIVLKKPKQKRDYLGKRTNKKSKIKASY